MTSPGCATAVGEFILMKEAAEFWPQAISYIAPLTADFISTTARLTWFGTISSRSDETNRSNGLALNRTSASVSRQTLCTSIRERSCPATGREQIIKWTGMFISTLGQVRKQ